ncbi:amidohydrolase family protein [Caldibacillus debilis]|uniref:amidohydrolase family protein n=1 Tax=Caldibacillus debilis TaxID=301148 RepID=UPI0023F4F47E|nr:amidohydrolase family protein [Caldibacillus debilis]
MLLKNATFLNSEMKWERGDLWIQNGKIRLLPAGNDAEDAVNCEDYLIVPGLVNAHFHGYSPLARGLVKDTELQDWFDGTVPGKIRKILIDYIDNVLSEEDFLALRQKSYVDMVKGGVTFVANRIRGRRLSCTAKPSMKSASAESSTYTKKSANMRGGGTGGSFMAATFWKRKISARKSWKNAGSGKPNTIR